MTDDKNPLDDEVEIVFRDGRTFRVAMLLETILTLEDDKKLPLDKIGKRGVRDMLTVVATAIQVECDPQMTEKDVAHNLGVRAITKLATSLTELMGGSVPTGPANGAKPGALAGSVSGSATKSSGS